MTIPARAKLHRSLLALLVAVAATTAFAQEDPHQTAPAAQSTAPQEQRRGGAQERPAPEQSVLRLLPDDAVSIHAIDTPAGKLDYTATAGTLSLFDQSGQRSAAIFYTAYIVKGVEPARRPLTFVFNGGPGAASAFLNLGLVGPKVAEFGPANRDATATRLADNPDTWLPFTDLVLIDPVGSGWSKPAKPDGGQAFWGVRRDAESLAKTIALYVSKNARSASPKYILGESYGGFRAAKVAQALRRDQGIAISGIVMVSPLLEGAFTFGGTRFALGAALQLPSLAASELERKGQFSKERLAEAERFAINEYLPMLAGRPPEGEAGKSFYAKVAEISGLPLDVVTKSRGFIRDAYVKNLRLAERKIVSRYDATYAIDDPYPEQENARGPDPLLDGVVRAYGGAFAAYARDELGFKTEMTYVLLASDISGKWDWGEGSGRANASVSEDIRSMLAVEPTFRLLVAHGYSDMVTPYAASRYVLDHLPAIGDPARAQLKLYRGGHMFYLDPESRRAFSTDAKAFYQEP
jgi:carboxypeptidase C (cathepsin A)